MSPTKRIAELDARVSALLAALTTKDAEIARLRAALDVIANGDYMADEFGATYVYPYTYDGVLLKDFARKALEPQ